jgi:hypothetical protein
MLQTRGSLAILKKKLCITETDHGSIQQFKLQSEMTKVGKTKLQSWSVMPHIPVEVYQYFGDCTISHSRIYSIMGSLEREAQVTP